MFLRFLRFIPFLFNKYPKLEFLKITLFNFWGVVYWNLFRDRKTTSINNFEFQGYSQNGEDGIIQLIFFRVGTTNKYFVEIGVGNGQECNTRYLKEFLEWRGLLIDKKSQRKGIKKEFITKEKVEAVFKKYKVPKEFDLLSVDVDGNDYWIWSGIVSFKPRVVVIEYNSSFPPPLSKVVEYDCGFQSSGTNYFGASLAALEKLGRRKGYVLIGCDRRGINAFFVKKSLVAGIFIQRKIHELYKPPKYEVFPKDSRKMIEV